MMKKEIITIFSLTLFFLLFHVTKQEAESFYNKISRENYLFTKKKKEVIELKRYQNKTKSFSVL